MQTTEIRLIFEPELSKRVSKKETLIVNEKRQIIVRKEECPKQDYLSLS